MNELKPCPFCKYKNRLKKVHLVSKRLPFWWFIECDNCHYCGETKLFLKRAIRAWNRKENDEEEIKKERRNDKREITKISGA